MKRTTQAQWAAVDWTKSNKEIAKLLQVTVATVIRHRGELGVGGDKIRADRPRWWKTDWSTVDWDDGRTDKQRAKDLGVSHGAVASQRARRNRMNRKTMTLAERDAHFDALGIGRLSDAAVALAAGVSRQAVYQMRARRGIPAPSENGVRMALILPTELVEALEVEARGLKIPLQDHIVRILSSMARKEEEGP